LAALAVFVAFAGVAFAAAASVLQSRENSVWIGNGGTALNLIQAYDLTFTDETSQTQVTGLPTGGTYYIATAWKTSSADPGKVVSAISAGTLTITVASATTGVCSVLIFGAP